RGNSLLIAVERIPGRNFLGPRSELGVAWNDAKLELALEGVLAVFVPALIELALELGDPFLGGVMRSVRRAGRVVDKERTIGGRGFFFADIFDPLVRQRVVERVAALHAFWNFHFDRRRVAIEGRCPLVRLATDEAVEMIESLAARPSVKRT